MCRRRESLSSSNPTSLLFISDSQRMQLVEALLGPISDEPSEDLSLILSDPCDDQEQSEIGIDIRSLS